MLDIEASPYPFAVRLYWDDHRPAHHRPPPDGISGWIRVSIARLAFPFASYERQLVSCVDEDGEVVSDFLKTRLLSLRRTAPRPTELYPPDESLADIEDDLTWDFSGAVDIELLTFLDGAIAERDRRLRRMEQRVSICIDEAEQWAAEKRRLCRDFRATPEMRRGVDLWLADLSEEIDRLGNQQRAEAERIRASTDGLESQVMASLGATPEVEHHCTFHWQVRHKRMTADRVVADEPVRLRRPRKRRD